MTKYLTTASAAALCALLAACGTTPNFPISDPDAAGPPPSPTSQNGYGAMAPIPDDPAPRAAPTQPIGTQGLPPPGPVSSSDLPPLGAAAPPAYTPPPARPAPARAAPGPCPPGQMQRTVRIPAPPAPPAPKPPGSGKVTNDTPAPVKVASGDTLIAISRKTGVFVKDLAELNDLKEPYKLKPGQMIKLPGKRYYTVAAGDNLFAVARRFGVTAAALAEFNDFEASKPIRAGQKINLPEGAKDKGAPVAPKVTPKPPQTRTECVVDPSWVPEPEPAPLPAPPPRPAPAPYPAPAPRPVPAPAPRPTPYYPAPTPAPAPRPTPAPAPNMPTTSAVASSGRCAATCCPGMARRGAASAMTG
jgi:LysM repeat protein